jgi:hypothetical protein
MKIEIQKLALMELEKKLDENLLLLEKGRLFDEGSPEQILSNLYDLITNYRRVGGDCRPFYKRLNQIFPEVTLLNSKKKR